MSSESHTTPSLISACDSLHLHRLAVMMQHERYTFEFEHDGERFVIDPWIGDGTLENFGNELMASGIMDVH